MADDTAAKQPAHLRDDLKFRPGKSGNPKGRPKGSRNKLGEAFLKAMTSDFDQHGPAVIAQVRADKPDQYLKAVASLIPKDLLLTVQSVKSVHQLTDDELMEIAMAGGLDLNDEAADDAGVLEEEIWRDHSADRG